ncbi:hypothetical protein [Streptomyces prunicolor]|uniref:hypothetical protein n=1 Tax=Streptomyces prunicolor TaxID=67348 RepID=UPI00340AE79E
MPSADRFLTVHRDPHSAEVLARGGDGEAHSVLERAGFVPVVRLHETYHRAPTGQDPGAENQLATEAVARLRAAGYHIDCDEDFATDHRPARYPTLGSSVARLADRHAPHPRRSTCTGEVPDGERERSAVCACPPPHAAPVPPPPAVAAGLRR